MSSIWDGIPNNEPQLSKLGDKINSTVINTYGDVLLTPEFKGTNVVSKNGDSYSKANPASAITADFALGKGTLRDFNKDGKLDQIYVENSDARNILGTNYSPGDGLGKMLRKDLAMILDIAGQKDYAEVVDLRNSIYDWVGYYSFAAPNNFQAVSGGNGGQGILSNLGDVNNDGITDWVINYKAASGKKGSGFGANGLFTIPTSSSAWTKGEPSATIDAGSTLFNVLSAQFEGACNLSASLDGSRVFTETSNGLITGSYLNNGDLNRFATTLPNFNL